VERAGGNPFDNTNTVYFGSDDDAALNRGVRRYTADPEAAEWMRQWYSIHAEIKDPVISVHALRDPIVPLKTLRAYDVASQIAGTSQLFVQKWVDQTGTAYNRVVVEQAFNELEAWIRDGVRPVPGEIEDPDHGRRASRETAEHFAELWRGAGPAPSARQP
jgi:hypothetical protein